MENISINNHYLQKDFIDKFSTCFTSGIDYHDEISGCTINHYPFTVATFPNFIQNKILLKNFIEKFNDLGFKQKLNDLHDFFQSPDLIKSPLETFIKISPSLESIIPSMTNSIKSWKETLFKLTDITLNNTIDCACQIYKTGGRLLCHDDALEGRRIAYILYLVDEEWSEADGGALELFTTDLKNGHPDHVAMRITPKQNLLAFFEVTPISYHQVAEVMAKKNKPRRSMTGWFHGPNPNYKMKDFLKKLPILYQKHSNLCNVIISPLNILGSSKFNSLSINIHPYYRQSNMVKKMHQVFKDESIIELKQFIINLPELDYNIDWNILGPANYCHLMACTQINNESLGYLLKFLAFSSDIQCILYELGCLNTEIKASSIWKISKGDYLLIHDEFASTYNGYDLYYFIIPDHQNICWKSSWGGSIRYNLDDSDTVIHMIPCNNSLYILKRTNSSQRCIDYVKKSASIFDTLTDLFYVCFHVGFSSNFPGEISRDE